MEIAKLTIEGPKLLSIVDLLKEKFYGSYLYSSNKVFALFIEKYYLRVNSNLLSVICMDFTDKKICKVEIISGGGAQGIVGLSLGSERSMNSKIIKTLSGICKSKRWKLKTGETKIKVHSPLNEE